MITNSGSAGFYHSIQIILCCRLVFGRAISGKPVLSLPLDMVKKILLRKASLDDAPAIIELYTETVLSVCVNDYTKEQLEIWANLGRDSKRWENRICSQFFIVAEIESSMAGFASLTPENYLDVFYVSKNHQGMGVANILFGAIQEKALASAGLIIRADVSITAKPFFEKQGFRLIKKQDNEIGGLVIANYHMEKSLQVD